MNALSAATAHLNLVIVQAQAPDPGPAPLPGKFGQFTDTALGWMKTILLIGAVGGLLAVGIMMVVGIRGRSDTAKNALGHAPWVFGGAALSGAAAAFVNAIQ